jgi:group I intron endonuclease
MKLYEINSKKKYDFSCIYLWTNLVNGKKYVGQTTCFYRRMKCYRCSFPNSYMEHAVNKYGIENFDISILERDVPIENLDEREQYWLDYYQSYDSEYGYNICHFASTTRGIKHTEEWCKEHSDWLKNKWATDEEYRKFWKGKMSGEKNYFYGKDFSGDKNGHAKSIICVEKNTIYTTVKEAAKENNTSRQNISHVLNGRQETAGGYHWEYV